MRRILVSWARPFAGSLALMLGLTFGAPPIAGAEPNTALPTQTPLTAAANAKIATIKLPPRALAQAAPATAAGESKGFFKSKAGVAAILLMAVGTGYMVHSAFKDNDPVASPIR